MAVTTCLAAHADTAPPKTTAYLGATLIAGSGAGTAPQPNTVIIVKGDRIAEVRPAAGFTPVKGQTVIDVHGKYIIPGLINTHVHVATFADVALAKAYLRREFYSGVTSVRDMAGDSRLLAELQREAAFDEIDSPDIDFVALMAGPEFFADPRTHDAARGRIAGQVPWMQAITPQTDLKIAVAEAKGTGATAIKIYADLPASLVKAITDEAHRQHLAVWAHAAVFPARPSDVVDAGVDVISHACMLGYELSNPPVQTYAHVTPFDGAKVLRPNPTMDALFADIKQHGTILDATFWIYERFPTPRCPPGANIHIAQEALRADIPMSTGTDDDQDMKDTDSALYAELRVLVEKVGMSPAQALRSATLIGARVLRKEADLGTVEPGKLANFAVLDRNPLERIDNIASVAIVVKHGIRHARSDYVPITPEQLKPIPGRESE